MNGAEALIKTLADNGVTACFANPGTSEMQFVAALDGEPRMRSVLCLFEGVATGAADGYGRMTGSPACTLLHLGPGYANGGANLHNAKRARTPVVNVIGDHATYHRGYDAPLNSDIRAWAAPNSIWIGSAETADDVGRMTSLAIDASLSKAGCASLILPADSAWNPTEKVGFRVTAPPRAVPPEADIEDAVRVIGQARKPVVLLGGGSCTEDGLRAAAHIAAAGVRVMVDTFVARLPRGRGRFAPDRMPYFGEDAMIALEGVDLIVLIETREPVAFFAYPDKPSRLVPAGCRTLGLCSPDQDGVATLKALAAAIRSASPALPLEEAPRNPALPTGALKPASIGASIARHMPDQSIISDDAVTAGLPIFRSTQHARPHDWLMLTGGAIGQGIPAAIGAAVACPDRRVLSLNGDGAAMYTLQGLWTIAREQLDVTVVIFANRAYRVLNMELQRTGGGGGGPKARRLLDIGDPEIQWTDLARGMGMPALRCSSAEQFDAALETAMWEGGPRLIEAYIA